MKYTQIDGQLHCDTIPVFHEGTSFGGRSYREPILVTQEVCDYANKVYNDEFPLQINQFTYNGFSGTVDKEVIMSYKAKFKKWTNDPGIVLCECNDNKERLIPTFAILASFLLPKRSEISEMVIFGIPSES